MKPCILFIAGLTAIAGSVSAQSKIKAFSIVEAQRQTQQRHSKASTEVSSLGGITRLLGLVYDRNANDVILIGRAETGEPPLDLDSLVTAVRALRVVKEWPLVSIDPAPDSASTGKQKVRLEGGIADSRFGNDFLRADVRLKRFGLGLDQPKGLPSYFVLRQQLVARGGTRSNGRSRFWFYAVDPGLEERDDVFLIRSLELGVRAQPVALPGASAAQLADPAADNFAAAISASFPQLSEEYPEIARLQSLYEMVAVARGMDAVPEALLAWWLGGYKVEAVPTPRQFDVIGRQQQVQTPDGTRIFEVSGGIQFRALTVRLLDGDVTALKEAVLLSRPSARRVSWEIPLDATVIGDRKGRGNRDSAAGDPNAGSTLVSTLAPPSASTAAHKAELQKNVMAVDAYLNPQRPVNLDSVSSGSYHSPAGGRSNQLESLGRPPCVSASCVGPVQQTSDGLKATPYAYGDLSRYSTQAYFHAGYSVSQGGKPIGSGYNDVKLLGGGIFAAKDGNSSGYRIVDSGGQAHSKELATVVPLDGQGHFAVPNERGLGMTTVYDQNTKPIRTLPNQQITSWIDHGGLAAQGAAKPVSRNLGGIKADVDVGADDFQFDAKAKRSVSK